MDPMLSKRLRQTFGRIPAPVIVIACLYLAVGVGGAVGHIREYGAPEWSWIEITEILAIVSGFFLLRAHSWARWLACAWMALHVIISVGDWGRLAIHSLFLAVISYCLFRPDSARFFKTPPTR